MIIVYPEKNYIVEAGDLYQWDYGQTIKFSGITLPESYIVHYSVADNGEAISVTGDASGASVPDDLLEAGENINGWIYVDDGETGTTEYWFRLIVQKKAKPAEPRPGKQVVKTVIAHGGITNERTIPPHEINLIYLQCQKPADLQDYRLIRTQNCVITGAQVGGFAVSNPLVGNTWLTIPFYLYNNSNETVTVTPELDVEGVIFYLGLEDS